MLHGLPLSSCCPPPVRPIYWEPSLSSCSLFSPYLVVSGYDGQGIRADLVGSVTVGDNPVSTHHHRVHLHKCGEVRAIHKAQSYVLSRLEG